MWNIWICTMDWLYLFTFFSGHFVFIIHLDERGHGDFKYLVRVRRDTTDLPPLSTKSYFTVATIHLKKTKRFIGKQFYCIKTFMYCYKCNFYTVIKRLEAGFSKQFGKKDTVHAVCFRFFTATVYDFSLNAFIIARNRVFFFILNLIPSVWTAGGHEGYDNLFLRCNKTPRNWSFATDWLKKNRACVFGICCNSDNVFNSTYFIMAVN